MHIVVLHNAVAADAAPDERDVLVQAEAVVRGLAGRGHRVEALGCTLNLSDLRRHLDALGPDALFNLVEGLDSQSRLLPVVPAALEAWGRLFAGSGSAALWITTHKVMAKERLAAAGLDTPAWIGPFPAEMPWPRNSVSPAVSGDQRWIVKSLWEHASFGLDDDPLVNAADRGELMRVLRRRAPQLGGACFAEEYIEGREFNLALLAGPQGPEILPPAEIVFEGYGTQRLRIVGYRAKWAEGSYEYRHTPRCFDFPESDAPLLARLRQTARDCWHLFNLRGWARVDFRVDGAGRPWILEVNANPCLSPDAGFAAALTQAGIDYGAALERILADT